MVFQTVDPLSVETQDTGPVSSFELKADCESVRLESFADYTNAALGAVAEQVGVERTSTGVVADRGQVDDYSAPSGRAGPHTHRGRVRSAAPPRVPTAIDGGWR